MILGAVLLGLLLSYGIASTLGSPRADRVEPIELDLLPDQVSPSFPAVTVPTSAIVVPPITLPPPAPPDDEDGDESEDDAEDEDHDAEDEDHDAEDDDDDGENDDGIDG